MSKRETHLAAMPAAAALLGLLTISACSAGQITVDGPTLLYFYEETCPICQAMNPIVEALEDRYGADFSFQRLNVESSRGSAAGRQYGIVGQPTFIFFDKWGEEVRRLMGPQDPSTLEFEIERLLEP